MKYSSTGRIMKSVSLLHVFRLVFLASSFLAPAFVKNTGIRAEATTTDPGLVRSGNIGTDPSFLLCPGGPGQSGNYMENIWLDRWIGEIR